MYTSFPEFLQVYNQLDNMSSECKSLFVAFLRCLAFDLNSDSVAGNMLRSVSDILPIALSVAGAVLVISLGWKLFRNFTKG